MIDLSPTQWQQRGQQIELLGRKLFLVDEGPRDAVPILLLHGFPTSSWDWAPIWPNLLERHRLVAFDYLGFGFSDKPKNHPYSVMEQADFADELVAKLDLQSFHVLAHDVGDTVAQELLARRHEGRGVGHWQSLCLLNGGLFPETHRALFAQKLLLSRVGFIANRLMSQRALDRSMCRVFGPDTQPTRETLDGFWEIVCHNDGIANFYRLIRYMAERRQHRDRWVGALQRAVMPVAMINGSVDPISGAHMVERYRNIVRADDYIVELPTIGHYPQVEAPQAVAEAYLKFLSGLA